MQLSERDVALINALASHFYEVVPHEYKTFCSLTSRISQAVLARFGIDAQLQPCQVWLVTPDHNYLVGFLGRNVPGKWDGHVVCKAGTIIIDAALKHFEKEFGLNVPNTIVSLCFDVPTQVISRCDLGTDARFWWHYPPAAPGLDVKVPEEPADVVEKYAALLAERLESLAFNGPAAQDSRTGTAATPE